MSRCPGSGTWPRHLFRVYERGTSPFTIYGHASNDPYTLEAQCRVCGETLPVSQPLAHLPEHEAPITEGITQTA